MFPSKTFKRIQCPLYCDSVFCLFGHFENSLENKRKPEEAARILDAIPKKPKLATESTKPMVQIDWKSEIPHKQRQKAADKIYPEFQRIYQKLNLNELAVNHTLEQELEISKRSTKLTYTNNCIAVIRRLKQRELALEPNDIGIDGVYKKRVLKRDSIVPLEKIEDLVVPLDILVQMDYPIWDDCKFKVPMDLPEVIECDRCSNNFRLGEDEVCYYHPLRYYKKTYPCCLLDVTGKGCTVGKHVFKVAHTRPYQSLKGENQLELIAMDCEMCYTTQGMEVVRVSVVDYNRNVLIDELVKPRGEILDFNTRFSGVSSLNGAVDDLDAIISKLSKFAGQSTIILGHGLENDLHSMGICHERILDTVALFPHDRGLPYRHSLRTLVKNHLGKFIQQGEHDSAEDAIACLDLLDFYLNKYN